MINQLIKNEQKQLFITLIVAITLTKKELLKALN